uniref:Endoglucanase EG-1 n=1 Tax=Humicola insolens TaxID=85995 RepID=GUN1B_HUMIN|nr:RecName: Full=Endoglucanase EG-1; AltName: Full=Cellulase; AltName: Full=Endo-1,4-beta-glucanase; Flags: Precursor [[Humicola] grisea var. thermoidea]BAA09786.1 Cellulase [[Humicola] grisea var. thermoidea]
MARGTALLGLTSLLLGLVNGQKPGETKEVHPQLTTFRCTKKGGCKPATNYIVLDSLSHPIHRAEGLGWGNCGDWGNPPPKDVCPDVESCAKNCIMEGIPDYSQYGVTTNGTSLRLQHILPDGRVPSPRVYLLDKTERRYEMLHLTGFEFTFDVDATKLPCGMNSALYLSEMHPTGAKSKHNPGGAYYGTGYCDAQCFVTPFINGLGNIEGKGSCCNEMDIWEANSRASHVAPHVCNKKGLYLCEGEECAFEGVCDKNGCGWNPYRVNVTDYYGRGEEFKVNTLKPFTVVTQFLANRKGKLEKIHRFYVQDGKIIESFYTNKEGIPYTNMIEDEFCAATGSRKYMELGATQGMGEALTRGMVLAMSIWWDQGGNMEWLDHGEAGPCAKGEGAPSNVVQVEPFPEVTYTNLRWGEIGSTYQEVQKPKPKPGPGPRSD